ncbi:MAG TPA: hypothetical protein VLX92_06435 [Kofleriaceae bacterium]|nr:hypothetical protein [Kofleriaceae bacterium]
MLATQTSTSTSSRAPLHSLDSLARRSFSELDALYRAATVSSSMHAADGALVGRMLAVRGVTGPLARTLRQWAASRSFLWEGKTFEASSEARGMGHNRVYVPNVLGRQNLFPFATSFGPSAIDDKPTLVLDYDLDANPGYIRHVHDEIREVSPALFLGPAMWERDAGDKVMILWFALDAGTARAARPS